MVTLFIEVGPIHSEVVARRCHGLLSGRECIHEAYLLLGRHFLHHLEIGFDIGVVSVSRRHSLDVLVGNGRNQHDASRVLAVVGLGFHAFQVFRQTLAKGGQSGLPRKGFVKPEGRQHDVRLHRGQMLFGVGEVGGTRLQVDFVRRPRKITNHQFLSGMSLLQERLEVPELMHAVKQGIADQAYACSLI